MTLCENTAARALYIVNNMYQETMLIYGQVSNATRINIHHLYDICEQVSKLVNDYEYKCNN